MAVQSLKMTIVNRCCGNKLKNSNIFGTFKWAFITYKV